MNSEIKLLEFESWLFFLDMHSCAYYLLISFYLLSLWFPPSQVILRVEPMALPTLSRYIATKLCPQFPYYELSILSTQEMFAGIIGYCYYITKHNILKSKCHLNTRNRFGYDFLVILCLNHLTQQNPFMVSLYNGDNNMF